MKIQPPGQIICQHCGEAYVGGLCRECWNVKRIRERYPTSALFGDGQDGAFATVLAAVMPCGPFDVSLAAAMMEPSHVW